MNFFAFGLGFLALGIALRSDVAIRSVADLEWDEKLAVISQYTSQIESGKHPNAKGLYYDLRAISHLRRWVGKPERRELRQGLDRLKDVAQKRDYGDITSAIDCVTKSL